jgi:hypothetical protein
MFKAQVRATLRRVQLEQKEERATSRRVQLEQKEKRATSTGTNKRLHSNLTHQTTNHIQDTEDAQVQAAIAASLESYRPNTEDPVEKVKRLLQTKDIKQLAKFVEECCKDLDDTEYQKVTAAAYLDPNDADRCPLRSYHRRSIFCHKEVPGDGNCAYHAVIEGMRAWIKGGGIDMDGDDPFDAMGEHAKFGIDAADGLRSEIFQRLNDEIASGPSLKETTDNLEIFNEYNANDDKQDLQDFVHLLCSQDSGLYKQDALPWMLAIADQDTTNAISQAIYDICGTGSHEFTYANARAARITQLRYCYKLLIKGEWAQQEMFPMIREFILEYTKHTYDAYIVDFCIVVYDKQLGICYTHNTNDDATQLIDIMIEFDSDKAHYSALIRPE